MLQNVYSLPDLIDLALIVPEVGAVNFNILHVILHSIIKELKLTDVRPWCHIENPILARAALIKSKLKGEDLRKSVSQGSLDTVTLPDKSLTRSAEAANITASYRREHTPQNVVLEPVSRASNAAVSDGEENAKKSTKSPSKSSTELKDKLTKKESDTNLVTRKVSAIQVEEQNAVLQTDFETNEAKRDSTAQIDISKPKERKDSMVQVDTEKENAVQTVLSSAHKEAGVQSTLKHSGQEKVSSPETTDREKKEEHVETTDSSKKSTKKVQRAGDAWKYTNLEIRVEAAEEGLTRLSNIVDIIADKFKKQEQRKKEGGPASEELEAIDERILALEELMDSIKEDHDIVMNIQKLVNDMLAEFEDIKVLASQMKQIQMDIDSKADKLETQESLNLKADLELCNSKVDQLEFETAIEELGEAIGELGLKFTRKVDEWEERANNIWQGINGKMSRDIFDAAISKTESRLTALMHGLRKMKRVVEDLLYPESSGVTRCILCRRPACISGLECFNACESPKRPFSERVPDAGPRERLMKTTGDSAAKRQKLEIPSLILSRETNIRSMIEQKTIVETPAFKLAPITFDNDNSSKMRKKSCEKVKLPNINGGEITTRQNESRKSVYDDKAPAKSLDNQNTEMSFTSIRNSRADPIQENKNPNEAVLESDFSEISTNDHPSSKSSSGADIMPDPLKHARDFSAIRRKVLLSPNEQNLNVSVPFRLLDTAMEDDTSSE